MRAEARGAVASVTRALSAWDAAEAAIVAARRVMKRAVANLRSNVFALLLTS